MLLLRYHFLINHRDIISNEILNCVIMKFFKRILIK